MNSKITLALQEFYKMNICLVSYSDTLFSYHKASEMFLQQIMSLYVASHYKVSLISCDMGNEKCIKWIKIG